MVLTPSGTCLWTRLGVARVETLLVTHLPTKTGGPSRTHGTWGVPRKSRDEGWGGGRSSPHLRLGEYGLPGWSPGSHPSRDRPSHGLLDGYAPPSISSRYSVDPYHPFDSGSPRTTSRFAHVESRPRHRTSSLRRGSLRRTGVPATEDWNHRGHVPGRDGVRRGVSVPRPTVVRETDGRGARHGDVGAAGVDVGPVEEVVVDVEDHEYSGGRRRTPPHTSRTINTWAVGDGPHPHTSRTTRGWSEADATPTPPTPGGGGLYGQDECRREGSWTRPPDTVTVLDGTGPWTRHVPPRV